MRRGGRRRFPWLVASWIAFFVCIEMKPVWAVDDLVAAAEEAVPDRQTEAPDRRESLPAEPEPPVYPDDLGKDQDRLTVVGNIDLSYSLSYEGSSNSLSGANASGMIAPRYRLSDATSLMVMYDGTYSKTRDFYSDEVGPRERTEYQRHTVTPMFSIGFGDSDRYRISPSFFYTTTYNKDVEGGGWDDGLYNYRDTGGSLDFTMGQLGFGREENGSLRFGIQYYERDYPNYTSLLDLATGLGLEEDERDYHGVLGRVRYNCLDSSGFSWGSGYSVLYKRLDDKKVVNSDGVLSTTDEQRDYLHTLDVGLGFVPESNERWRLGLDLGGSFNRSNQNYYDAMGSLNILAHEFFEDYYDYDAYRIGPSVSYMLPTIPLTCKASYWYQKTDYTDRKAQNSDGTYKDDEQYEQSHIMSLGLWYALLDNWSIYLQWQHIDTDSNNENEAVYAYSHTVNNYYAGTEFSF